jgi:hypothetical protein
MSDELSRVLDRGRSPKTGTVWTTFASNPDMPLVVVGVGVTRQRWVAKQTALVFSLAIVEP